jgi:crossover junction endodeoxyribonuclease RuvC
VICGIDPGLDGAIALVSEDLAKIVVLDMPTFAIKGSGKTKRRTFDLYQLAQWMDLHAASIKRAVIEEPSARPGEAPSSAFKFGFGCGLAQTIVAAHFIPVTLASPARWKRAMGLSADKDDSRRLASRLVPRHSHLWPLKKHDGRAEAVLLAIYGMKGN